MSEAERVAWWRGYDIEEASAASFQVGPLTLWVGREPHEWRIAWCRGPDPSDPTCAVDLPGPPEPPAEAELQRFALGRTEPRIELTPVAADRPVVTRPETPFTVLPGGEVTVFVGTPAWIRLSTGAPPQVLLDVPISRPTDTWFGPSTREGELCYGSRTHARLRLERMPRLPGRVLTRVDIRNEASEPLLLERLKLPAQRLALYADPEGQLWTSSMVVARPPDGSLDHMEIEAGSPADAPGAVRLAEPRQLASRSALVRALEALLA